MWYTITLLSLLCCTCLPASSLRDTNDTIRGRSTGWETGFILADAPHRSGLLAQQGQSTAPDRKEPTPEKQDTTTEKAGQNKEAPQQKDKKPPPRAFVPSEKIDADNAVDFPADI